MPWIISFIVSWAIFAIAVDISKLKYNVFGGIIALILATFVDWGGQYLGLYSFNTLIIAWFGCSAFYKFGPIFTTGILFTQYVPNNRYLQAINILVFAVLFISLETLILLTGVAKYIHWHTLASFTVDILAFASLTWYKIVFLKNKKE